MKYLLNIMLIFVYLSVWPSYLPASKEDLGTTGATFLKIGIGARALALGETYISLGNDLEAMFHNPAGLNFITNQELNFMHLDYFDDISYEYLGYAKRLSPSRILAGGLSCLHMGRFTKWDKEGNELGSFSAGDTLLSLSYAQSLTEDEDAFMGTNVKLIYQRLSSFVSKSVALDLGLLKESGVEGLRYGVSLQNLGTKVKFDKTEDKLPLNLKLGLSYQYLDEAMITGLDINIPNDGKINLHLGHEYTLGENFILRLGYQNGPAKYAHGFGGGFGIKYGDLALSYAFVPYNEELGNSHYISLLYQFGLKVEEKVKKPKAKEDLTYQDEERDKKKESKSPPEERPKINQELLPELAKETKLAKEKKLPKKEEIPQKKAPISKIEKFKDKAKETTYPEYEYYLKKYPEVSKMAKDPKNVQREKVKKRLDFEDYVNLDLFKDEEELTLREERKQGAWTMIRKITPPEKPKVSRELKEERKSLALEEREPLETYKVEIYKEDSYKEDSYKEDPFFKSPKKEMAFNEDWSDYAYDPDTYEYFKKKYGFKEKKYKTLDEYPELKKYLEEEKTLKEEKPSSLPVKKEVTEEKIKEEKPKEEKPASLPVKLPVKKEVTGEEIKEEKTLKEEKPSSLPVKKEEDLQKEDIWEGIKEEVIKELCR
ncbi:PorV/PorQ family protein [bacterium]|nr:PorV/PorQ family protein [bacterium]